MSINSNFESKKTTSNNKYKKKVGREMMSKWK
jgi:hypothetical protein